MRMLTAFTMILFHRYKLRDERNNQLQKLKDLKFQFNKWFELFQAINGGSVFQILPLPNFDFPVESRITMTSQSILYVCESNSQFHFLKPCLNICRQIQDSPLTKVIPLDPSQYFALLNISILRKCLTIALLNLVIQP